MNVNTIVKSLDNIDLGPKKEPTQTGKVKSWLGEYHWVKLAYDPELSDNTQDAINWCKENFTKSSSRWFEKDKKFFFKDERDMSMFILRWS